MLTVSLSHSPHLVCLLLCSFRSQDSSVVIHDDYPPDILETSREYDDDSFVAIPDVPTNHSRSDSEGFGEIGNSYDQVCLPVSLSARLSV